MKKPEAPIDIVIAPENLHWGGSELLWSKLAFALKERRYNIVVLVFEALPIPSHILNGLEEKGILLYVVDYFKTTKFQSFLNRFLPYDFRFRAKDARIRIIENISPKLVLSNKGFNVNGIPLTIALKNKGIKYITLSHGVSEFYWPNIKLRKKMRESYLGSEHNFFVSKDNLMLTELQLGISIKKSSVIRNPYQVPYDNAIKYPEHKDFHLACVGRYDFKTKGQDILLRVLKQDKWQSRPLVVHFFGEGEDEENLRDIVSNFNLKNVKIHKFTPTIEIWKQMHGLVLPSRSEGLPVSLVEAMLCGRMSIITDVGGSLEVVLPNETGFVASAPRLAYLDDAMERAWQERNNWQAIGERARSHIKKLIPHNPECVFADQVIKYIELE